MNRPVLLLFLSAIAALCPGVTARAEGDIDKSLPVRGLAIEAPSQREMDSFLQFVEEELAPAHFNLLILRVDWNYAYETHPELRDEHPLTR
ncbi:MAG: glycoside hydrolase, partial [Firmicutes bacterium]|nr:glycoside hydrolase [Bacillota bacterium]